MNAVIIWSFMVIYNRRSTVQRIYPVAHIKMTLISANEQLCNKIQILPRFQFLEIDFISLSHNTIKVL